MPDNAITTGELAARLREHAEWCDANEWESPLCLGDDLRAAADRLIELEAKLEEAVEDMALIAGTSNDPLVCSRCIYNPNDMGCELDGSQFGDNGECHFAWRRDAVAKHEPAICPGGCPKSYADPAEHCAGCERGGAK